MSCIFHSNKYNAASACAECDGIIRHEGWCSVVNPRIRYARAVQEDLDALSIEDRHDLQGLGVTW